jgi:hypothetical protein
VRAATLRRLTNLWPPFFANGIRVLDISDDWSRAEVVLRRRLRNRARRQPVRGNLFAMTDPFWMPLAMHRLGPDYYVWDKAAEIEFVKPAREQVYARFHLDDDAIAELRAAAASGNKVLRWFETEVVTRSGETVARVRKQLYVRLKPRARGTPAA